MNKENSGNSTEMPKYQSHKQVWALKIKSIVFDVDLAKKDNRETDGGAIITPEEERFSPFKVDHVYVSKHSPEVGGYYVVYEGGYESWSPADAFESDYTNLDKLTGIDQSIDAERLSRWESIQIAKAIPGINSSSKLIDAAEAIERYLKEGTIPG